MPRVVIVTDADACIPDRIRSDLGIVTIPLEVAPYEEDRWQVPVQPDPVPASAVLTSCMTALDRTPDASALLYVVTHEGYEERASAIAAVSEALATAPRRARLAVHHSHASLMGCGWQVIAAALAAARGAGIEECAAAASEVRDSVQVLVMLERSRVPDAEKTGLTGWMRNRAVARLERGELDVLTRPTRRDAGLVALRDRLGLEAAAGTGALRLAVHHAGTAPAAEAMARWAEQMLHPDEIVITPLTQHVAARLGAGMLGFAWYRERASEPA